MGGELGDVGVAIEYPVPDVVLDLIRLTETAEVLDEDQIGIGLRMKEADLITVLAAGSARTARSLVGQVRAFIGPSYASKRSPASEILTGTPFNDRIIQMGSGHPLLVLVTPRERTEDHLRALERLIEVRSRTPLIAAQTVRPLALVLRDFEAAVARGDVAGAVDLRAQAWGTGRLSLVNRSFLDTRVKAIEGDYEGLLDLVNRLRLADLHLPGPVELSVVDAVARCHPPPLHQASRDDLVEAFRTKVSAQFGAVFRDHRLAASPEARWAWTAHYLSIEPIPWAALEEVFSQTNASEREQLVAVVGPIEEPAPSANEVRTLAEGGENAAVFAAARKGEELPAKLRAQALSRSTSALGDPVRDAQAQAILTSSADPGEQTATQSPFGDVDDWESWLRSLFEHPDAEDASKVLDNGAARWTENLRSSESNLDGWDGYVGALSGEPTFRRALPLLASAVLPSGPEADRLVSERTDLLLSLTTEIAGDRELGTPGLDAISDLAVALISTGLDDEFYLEVFACCERVYLNLSSPPRLAAWVVDLIQSVLEGPAPSNESREAVMRNLVALLFPDAQRTRPLIGGPVWIELAELLEDLGGLGELLPTVRAATDATVDSEDFSALEGKTVLIHTLVESAAARAGEYLESLVDVRVQIDNSHVGGDQLRDLAKNADMVVFASRAAKHAAFECIRPAAGDRLTYARGKAGQVSLRQSQKP